MASEQAWHEAVGTELERGRVDFISGRCFGAHRARPVDGATPR
jgi:hypothetical protein